MKHFLLEQAGEGNAAGSAGQPDIKKVLEDGLKGLGDEIKKLNQRIDAKEKPAIKPAKKEEQEEDLSTMMLLDPAKAVQTITKKVKEEVMGSVDNMSQAQQQFSEKYSELLGDYPEIGNQSSDLFTRAKEIMTAAGTGRFDSGAMERAVLKAAAEKGIQPMKFRKKTEEQEEGDPDFLGSSSGSGEGRRTDARRRSEKLPAATLAFAEAVGLNVKDPKVVESLTKRHNERKGNWNKYR